MRIRWSNIACRDLDAEGCWVSRRYVEALGVWIGLRVGRVNHNTNTFTARHRTHVLVRTCIHARPASIITHLTSLHLNRVLYDWSQPRRTGSLHIARPSSPPWLRPITAPISSDRIGSDEWYKHLFRREVHLSQRDPRDALHHVHCVVHKGWRSVELSWHHLLRSTCRGEIFKVQSLGKVTEKITYFGYTYITFQLKVGQAEGKLCAKNSSIWFSFVILIFKSFVSFQ